MELPLVRGFGAGAAAVAGSGVLAGLAVWGRMQPLAMAAVFGCAGWLRWMAALGAGAGYLLFWGPEGYLGLVWAAGGLVLALWKPKREHLALGSMFLAALLPTDPMITVLRMILAGFAALLAGPAAEGDRLARWAGWSAGVMALSQRLPYLGSAAAGFAMGALPLPGGLLLCLGADLALGTELTMMAAAAFGFRRFLRPKLEFLSPAMAAGALMLLTGRPDFRLLAAGLGGALVRPAPNIVRSSGVGKAQVRLEQASGIFASLRRRLLESSAPEPDIPALTEQLRLRTCALCPARTGCGGPDAEALTGDRELNCKRPDLSQAELRRSRDQLRRLRAARARQEEYRMALVQQYGFLSDAMRTLSDDLASRERRRARFRVRLSARSRSRRLADGDRVTAFSAPGCRYYILLCDGMGTGLGAAEESRQTAMLIQNMLTAGLPPEAALECVNSQLILTGRGGAVTVDLAELHLDTGRARLYKWGACPSWLLRRARCLRLGDPGPPPGLTLTPPTPPTRTALSSGELLLLTTDGITPDQSWSTLPATPKEAANQILSNCHTNDDATVVAVQLEHV